MAEFDFDTPLERRGTDSQKWQKYEGTDVLPMWVADMDFRSPPAVLEALGRRVAHGAFGYARPARSTIDAVVAGFEARYGWRIDPSWIVWLPGLVCGINLAIEAFAGPGEEVLSLAPVYPPFLTAPRNRGRAACAVPLALSHGRWEIDWSALERSANASTRILLLCHPHNPVGRIWTREELARLGEFCGRRNILLISDEIHCDLILDPDRRHVPAALAVPPSLAPRVITLMAPSKTYNVPGLGTSLAVVPDPALRTRLVRASAGIVAEVTALGYAACEAAYRDCEPWRRALIAYLAANRDALADFVNRKLPGVRIEAPIEATYLGWLNVAETGLDNPVGRFEAHGVGLSDGAAFGAPPGRYVRLNFGCPRATLMEGLRRMASALSG